MRHISIPQSLTDSALREWLDENKFATDNHVVKVDYEPEEIQAFEHQIANNHARLLELEDLKKAFNEVLKDGTDVEHGDDGSVKFLPRDFTIPGTKGMKALKDGMKNLTDKIARGYEEQVTTIFMIPYPEKSLVIGVDAQGTEYPQYNRSMTPEEEANPSLFKEEATEEVTLEEVAHQPKKQKKAKKETEAFGEELDL